MIPVLQKRVVCPDLREHKGLHGRTVSRLHTGPPLNAPAMWCSASMLIYTPAWLGPVCTWVNFGDTVTAELIVLARALSMSTEKTVFSVEYGILLEHLKT